MPKISALPAVTTPAGTDQFVVNQGGTSSMETLAQIRQSLGTIPTIASVGSAFSGTGAPTATLPGTHAANDILVLALQSSNESNITAPAGYQQLGPQNGIGAAATAGSVKLSLFWKRDGGSESAPTIPDTGDHTYGVIIAVRGCPTTGDPFDIVGNAFKFTASTTGTSHKGATRCNNCLVMTIFGHAVDSASAQASAETNADLTSITEQFDGATTDGTGGGIAIVTGVKAASGSFASTTLTWANSTVDVSTVIAFLPVDAVEVGGSHPTEVQVFIGSPTDLDDLWVKPSGARAVRVQMMDGGGGGSSGRNAATAAGGGGGGGGGYCEGFYDADVLPATVTVHAGKGGAATANSDGAAGNPGVVSKFGVGLTPVILGGNRIAGTAATASASADGGNGGCGSGIGLLSPPVAATRIEMTAATAGAAIGGKGAAGGSGTTGPTGGSNAEYGGGGGESGADTDAAVALNGDSMYGGGGGASGRSSGTLSTPGRGGGAAAPSATRGVAGNDSTYLPYGGSGGNGGDSTTGTGGAGGFPGGGGGGGGTASGTQAGGRGGHGCVVVTTFF